MVETSKIYKTFISSDGFEILVGKSARSNDILTFKLSHQNDFWLHVAPTSGSHVIIRNPDNLSKMPKSTLREAAALAIFHSKSKSGGRVAVNYTQCRNVRKERGAPAGQVQIQRFQTVKASPQERPEEKH